MKRSTEIFVDSPTGIDGDKYVTVRTKDTEFTFWLDADTASWAGKELMPKSIAEQVAQDDDTKRRCPDDGACHHECDDGPCWRVTHCGPLSNVFPGDEWPLKVRREHCPHTRTIYISGDTYCEDVRCRKLLQRTIGYDPRP